MSQFTVYINKNPKTKKTFPYLLDIQSDLLEEIHTTVVIPLGEYSIVKNQIMTKLCPIIDIEGNQYVAITQQLAGIDRHLLGEAVTNISSHRTQFIDAVDFIISGI